VRTAKGIASAFVVCVSAACSPEVPTPGSADLNRAEALRTELASSRLTSANAIVADFEVPPTAVPVTKQAASKPVATPNNPAPQAPAAPALHTPSFALVNAVVVAPPRAATLELPAPTGSAAEAPPPAPMGGDDTGNVVHTVVKATPEVVEAGKGGARPKGAISVRGGPTSPTLDPCATHVQVNAPRGPALVNNRLPTTNSGGVQRLPR
jgi:hypothetical protein